MSSRPRPAPTPGRGCLVVISGPSGAGKTSICNELLQRLPNAEWSVSVTTRPRRPTEVNGISYRFVRPEHFEEMRRADEFLESAEYLGHWYGTPRQPAEEAVARGRIVVMEIDVQGGVQVAEKVPRSIRIFVLPPTPGTLQDRLKGRQTESEDTLQKRLAHADGEIAYARDSGCYPHFVVNDVLEDTVRQVLAIIQKEIASQ